MSIIDLRLIDAYMVMVLAEKYIVHEDNRQNSEQKLVPKKYQEEVLIKVAEKTIQSLEKVE